VAGDRFESEDVAMFERIDGDDFEEDVARVSVVGILTEQLREGLLGELIVVVVPGAGCADLFWSRLLHNSHHDVILRVVISGGNADGLSRHGAILHCGLLQGTRRSGAYFRGKQSRSLANAIGPE